MLYIVGTEITVKMPVPGQPGTSYGVNKTLQPRTSTLFPSNGVWVLGRIYKNNETEKLVYDFYTPGNTVSLEFNSFTEADSTIARARGEKIIEDDDTTSKNLQPMDIEAKYNVAEKHEQQLKARRRHPHRR